MAEIIVVVSQKADIKICYANIVANHVTLKSIILSERD